MPPAGVVHGGFIPVMTMIPENEKRRLEHQYSPNQSLSPRRAQDQAQKNTHQLPTRMAPSLPPSSETIHQNDRNLPSREVTDENFDETYVSFIMYCNPSIPPDTDTTELRRIFRAPPKSDGKNFSTFTLFELIRK